MIGIFQQYSKLYLYIVAVGTFLCFGLPMFIAPLAWARRLGWRIAEPDHLAIYFGRCLGGLICVLAGFAFIANEQALLQRYFYNLILANFIVMVIVHLYGALKNIQPWLENLEIGFWLLLFLMTLLFYPA
jgi:hypothetical protein